MHQSPSRKVLGGISNFFDLVLKMKIYVLNGFGQLKCQEWYIGI